jgi:hypothetical protein
MSVYVSVELRRQVSERFTDCCAYCHTAENLTVAIFEVEHILPRSAGGETAFENLCVACPTCNRYKSNQGGGSSCHGGHQQRGPQRSVGACPILALIVCRGKRNASLFCSMLHLFPQSSAPARYIPRPTEPFLLWFANWPNSAKLPRKRFRMVALTEERICSWKNRHLAILVLAHRSRAGGAGQAWHGPWSRSSSCS